MIHSPHAQPLLTPTSPFGFYYLLNHFPCSHCSTSLNSSLITFEPCHTFCAVTYWWVWVPSPVRTRWYSTRSMLRWWWESTGKLKEFLGKWLCNEENLGFKRFTLLVFLSLLHFCCCCNHTQKKSFTKKKWQMNKWRMCNWSNFWSYLVLFRGWSCSSLLRWNLLMTERDERSDSGEGWKRKCLRNVM